MRGRVSAVIGALMLFGGMATVAAPANPAAAATAGVKLGFPAPPVASAGSIPAGSSLTFNLRSTQNGAAAPNVTVYVCQCLLVAGKPGASVPGDSTTVPASQCGGVSTLNSQTAALVRCTTNSQGQLALTYHTPSLTVAQGRADWVGQLCSTSSCGGRAIEHYVYCTVYRFNSSPIAAPGSLGASQSASVTLTAKDGLNNASPQATVFLSFAPAPGGGSASVGGTKLTKTAQRFTTDSSGSLTITYTAPGSVPSSGVDVITAKSAPSGSLTETATDSYAFSSRTPVISIGDINVVEGDEDPGIPAEFTVTISPAQSTSTTFQFVTLCGIGDKGCGEDFVQVNSPVTVTIPAGANYATVIVKQFAYVGGNAGETYNEGFYVEIEHPSAGVLGRTIGDGMLLPDIEGVTQPLADLYTGDAAVAPVSNPASSHDAACGSSGNVPMFFTVTLGAATKTNDVTFHYATSDGTARAGVDYVATSGTATISAAYNGGAPGHQTNVEIPVCLLPGATADRGAQFHLTISNAQGGNGNVTIPSIYQTGTATLLSPNSV